MKVFYSVLKKNKISFMPLLPPFSPEKGSELAFFILCPSPQGPRGHWWEGIYHYM
jgi:hypothetical protein